MKEFLCGSHMSPRIVFVPSARTSAEYLFQLCLFHTSNTNFLLHTVSHKNKGPSFLPPAIDCEQET